MKSSISWILIAVVCSLVFCGTFVYFYTKSAQRKFMPTADVEKKIGEALPKTNLSNSDLQEFSDENLRKGKVILVFFSPTCEACETEGEFLKNIVGKRNDIKFYGVTSSNTDILNAVKEKFPFDVVIDKKLALTFGLGIRSIPTKVYLEDGIIKKVWRGASIDETKQTDFVNWFNNI